MIMQINLINISKNYVITIIQYYKLISETFLETGKKLKEQYLYSNLDIRFMCNIVYFLCNVHHYYQIGKSCMFC